MNIYIEIQIKRIMSENKRLLYIVALLKLYIVKVLTQMKIARLEIHNKLQILNHSYPSFMFFSLMALFKERSVLFGFSFPRRNISAKSVISKTVRRAPT